MNKAANKPNSVAEPIQLVQVNSFWYVSFFSIAVKFVNIREKTHSFLLYFTFVLVVNAFVCVYVCTVSWNTLIAAKLLDWCCFTVYEFFSLSIPSHKLFFILSIAHISKSWNISNQTTNYLVGTFCSCTDKQTAQHTYTIHICERVCVYVNIKFNNSISHWSFSLFLALVFQSLFIHSSFFFFLHAFHFHTVLFRLSFAQQSTFLLLCCSVVPKNLMFQICSRRTSLFPSRYMHHTIFELYDLEIRIRASIVSVSRKITHREEHPSYLWLYRWFWL